MSVAGVMTAWQSFLSAAPFAIQTYLRYPPTPYVSGTQLYDGTFVTAVYPFVVIRPGDQSKLPVAGGTMQQSGFYHLLYVDQMGATYTNRSSVEAAAAAFAELVGDTLAATVAGRTLGNSGAVSWAGAERGVIARYDEASWGRDDMDKEIYLLPIDVHVRAAPQAGV